MKNTGKLEQMYFKQVQKEDTGSLEVEAQASCVFEVVIFSTHTPPHPHTPKDPGYYFFFSCLTCF